MLWGIKYKWFDSSYLRRIYPASYQVKDILWNSNIYQICQFEMKYCVRLKAPEPPTISKSTESPAMTSSKPSVEVVSAQQV